jgi:hypothetical protein
MKSGTSAFGAGRQLARRLWLVTGAACLALACASPIKTAFDADPGVDMTRYTTYAWISTSSLIAPTEGVMRGDYISPIDDQRIRREVDGQLQARGYRPADRADADLIVTYGVGSKDQVRVTDTPGRSSYYYGGYGYGPWYQGSTVNVQQYTEGTLTIELFDRKTKDAVWVGWGSKRLSKSDERDEVIQQAVQKILAPLPGHATSGSNE